MPMIENRPVKVTLVVQVDGYTLTFDETGEANGARYHGKDPQDHGYSTNSTLESSVRATVGTCVARATALAEELLRCAYPVTGDHPAGPPA